MPFPDLPQPAEALPSLVEGITVFRLAEQKAEHQEIVSFSCPNCGGNKAYSTASNALVCTHCGYEVSPSQAQSPPAEIRSAFATPTVQDKHEFRQEIIVESRTSFVPANVDISCQNCGAELTIPPQHLSHTCPFCNSHQVIQQKRPENALSPQALIRFSHTPQDCMAPAKTWLGSFWLVPKDLREAVNLREFEQVYVPYWAFDARADANWEAEVGYEETRRYYEDGEWKSKTVTRWVRETGFQKRHVQNLLVPGSFHMDKRLLEQVHRFRMDSLEPFSVDYLAGIPAQAYEVSLEDAWTDGRSMIREQMKGVCREDALAGDADKVRNLSLKMELEEESWQYVLMPFLLSSFRYEERQYQIIVNGQTGELAGYRPIDWRKFNLIAVLAFIPVLLAVAFAFFTYEPQVPLLVALGLAIVAGVSLYTVYRKAKRIQG